MADTEKKFSELETAGVFDGSEFAAVSQTTNGQLMSVKATLQAIANWFAINSQYTSALNTTSKTLTGAINELKQLIALIPQFSIEVVQTLPTEDISETTIYLVPNSDPEVGNYYEEYIYVNNAWELLGTTAVDLSGYYTALQCDAKYPVTLTNVAASSATTKKVADVTQNGVTTSLYADDAEKVLKKILNEEHTVTGNPISFDAWLGLEYAKSCEVTFSPIQSGSGDPSPENVRPISGWDSLDLNVSGKNICQGIELGLIDQTTGQDKPNTENYRTIEKIPCYENGKITISGFANSRGRLRIFYYSGANYINHALTSDFSETSITLSIPSGCNAIRLQGSTSKFTQNVQAEIGNQATDYEPYQGTTHTATFPDTVYGGKVVWNGDGSCKAIIDMPSTTKIKVSDLSWGYASSGAGRVESASLKNYIKKPEAQSDISSIIAEFIKTDSVNNIYSGENAIGVNTNGYIWVHIDKYTDETTFLQDLGDYYIYYPLATPTEITLTAEQIELLKGQNVLWTDSNGNITLVYSADIKSYIAEQLSSLS